MAVRFVHAHIQGLAEHTPGRSVHMGQCGSSVVVVSSVLLLPVESPFAVLDRRPMSHVGDGRRATGDPRRAEAGGNAPQESKLVKYQELLRIFYPL